MDYKITYPEGTRESKPFGDIPVYDLPGDCNSLVLAFHDGSTIRPYRVMLPGQVYTKTLEQLLKEHPEAKEFWVIPFNHEDYRRIGKVEPA
jgi:hypothetical protein